VVAVLDGPRRLIRFTQPIEPYLERIGHVPLPPYIHTSLADPERYQTVYAHQPGSAAAPTAGLHFTPRLLASLAEQGIEIAQVTLHVGLDTFAPVNEDDPAAHQIHTEWCQVPKQAAEIINRCSQKGGRVIAVGTTSVRSLEAAARAHAGSGTGSQNRLQAYEGATDLFILPGHRFLAVDGMVTNFHLPRSTLIMLVSAFAGRERILQAYETAKNAGYRFYSFGDAMLILSFKG
jgi:S-adenosylmethionine:tRNA ribosyltransferase-isomerase